jgi:hypothetical protein
MSSMSRWLARLSFSFLILAGFLFWEGYREMTRVGGATGWRVGLYFIGGGISLGLALRGAHERHKNDGD